MERPAERTWPSLIGLIGKLQDTHLIEEGGWEPEDCWRLMVRLELIRIFVLPPDPAIRELDHVDQVLASLTSRVGNRCRAGIIKRLVKHDTCNSPNTGNSVTPGFPSLTIL